MRACSSCLRKKTHTHIHTPKHPSEVPDREASGKFFRQVVGSCDTEDAAALTDLSPLPCLARSPTVTPVHTQSPAALSLGFIDFLKISILRVLILLGDDIISLNSENPETLPGICKNGLTEEILVRQGGRSHFLCERLNRRGLRPTLLAESCEPVLVSHLPKLPAGCCC